MKYAVIFNTLCGRRSERRNRRILNQLKDELTGGVIEYLANTKADLKAAIKDIQDNSITTVIVCGGDGTLNRVCNALIENNRQSAITLAIIPTGTGNSFALDLGITDIKTGIDAIRLNNSQLVDVGVVTHQGQDRYFVNNIGIGLVYDIAKLASKMKSLGRFSYTLATLIKLARLPSYKLSILNKNERSNQNVLFLNLCNSRFTGGKMMMAPDAKLDDGKLQLIALDTITRAKLLKTFPKIFEGTHTSEQFIQSRFVTELTIASRGSAACLIDGDLSFSLPVTIKMSKLKLSFLNNNGGQTHSTV